MGKDECTVRPVREGSSKGCESPAFPQSANGTGERLRDQDNFSGGARLQDFDVCAGGLGQRYFFAHHRAKRSIFQTSNQTCVYIGLFDRCKRPKG